MLTADFARQAKQLRLRTRRLVDGSVAGAYHSVFKGRGTEFIDVREYMPGDDIRTIDWNVTARQGIPFVKRYIEERELTVMLAIDMSASTRFGSTRKHKLTLALELAAIVAFSALRNNDRVGLLLFSDRIERFVPPGKGRRHGLRLFDNLQGCQPTGQRTDIALALNRLNHLLHQHSLTFLISDFLATDYQRALYLAQRRHELIPVLLSDPAEDTLPALGLLRLQDPESGEELLLDSSDARVRAFCHEQMTALRQQQRRVFATLGLNPLELNPSVSPAAALLRFFHQQEQRR